METFFVGSNLRLARTFQGLTLEEVAEQVGKSKQFIHKLETNLDQPTEGLASLLADRLDVYPDFFYDRHSIDIVEDQFHFRKLRTTKVASKQKALAKGEVFKRLVDFLETKLDLPKYDFIDRPVSCLEDIEVAAENLRSHLSLGVGPIQNITRVAENAGAFVTTFQGISSEVDALSISASRPVIVRNEVDRYSCRLRFDIAHEIGHFVMHGGMITGDRATESEANRFGGAFLLPRSSFAKEFPVSASGRISWKSLSEVKLRWKSSKASMLMRARQLCLLDDHQLRGGIIKLKNDCEAKKEAEDDSIEIERPVLLDKAIRLVTRHYGLSLDDIARALKVKTSYITEFISQDTIDELTLPSNVVRFPAIRQSLERQQYVNGVVV
ncbi:helix-turn-helix domain-containing protein [Undibacterium sp. Ji67W]|uniref:helix-turn-helix domain-containing protein n=1 Tax=Undibacterium sp. Ji67W TaxID=3413042 RepID=UPI003BF0D483